LCAIPTEIATIGIAGPVKPHHNATKWYCCIHTPSQCKEKQTVVKSIAEDNNQHQVEYYSFTKHPAKS